MKAVLSYPLEFREQSCAPRYSGHGPAAPTSIATLQKLFRDAKHALIVLPGSGINPDNVGALLESLGSYGVKEIHLSAGEWIPTTMSFKKEGMGMGIGAEGEWGVWRTKEETVRAVKKVVDDFTEARKAKRALQIS